MLHKLNADIVSQKSKLEELKRKRDNMKNQELGKTNSDTIWTQNFGHDRPSAASSSY